MVAKIERFIKGLLRKCKYSQVKSRAKLNICVRMYRLHFCTCTLKGLREVFLASML